MGALSLVGMKRAFLRIWWGFWWVQFALTAFSLGAWGVAVTFIPFELFKMSWTASVVFGVLAVNLWSGVVKFIAQGPE